MFPDGGLEFEASADHALIFQNDDSRSNAARIGGTSMELVTQSAENPWKSPSAHASRSATASSLAQPLEFRDFVRSPRSAPCLPPG